MLKKFKKITSALLACALLCILAIVPAQAAQSNQLVHIDLWNAAADKASMGNIATDNNKQALYNPAANTLQIATNPVDVSGYRSAITAGQYDSTGNGDYVDVTILTTDTMETGTKNDGVNHTVTYLSSFEIELPDYIAKTGVEYIPIKMKVPYTPMDVVVGTGYLDARLRIDWSQVETTTLSQIEPDSTISSGTVEDVNLKDYTTGVTINTDSATVASNATLSVTKITTGVDYEAAKTALSGTATDFDLLEIKLMSGTTELEPNGAVEIVFPYTGELSLYRINDDGTKTVLRGTSSNNGYIILTTKVGLFAIVGGTKLDTNPFTDVTDHWAEDYILQATEEGLFNGTSDTTFSPDDQMTCGMVITVLYRMAGSPTVTVPSPMENVESGSWYETACAWGYENSVIGGYKTFDPEVNVTREELATMIYLYHALTETPMDGADLSGFSDASSISQWAKEGLAWANAAGIVSGTSETTISPADNATRAQVATMLCRYLDYIA